MDNKTNDQLEERDNNQGTVSEVVDNVKNTEFNTLPFKIIQNIINVLGNLFKSK